MQLIDSILYDPDAAVTKATDTLSVMTALDTTNLRLTFRVPASGKVHVVLRGCIHGSSTWAGTLLGVLSGTVLVGRQPSLRTGASVVTTAMAVAHAEFTVDATPGETVTWDAAYAVQVVAASSAIKYGGSKTSVAGNDSFGGFLFEVWDPQPNLGVNSTDYRSGCC